MKVWDRARDLIIDPRLTWQTISGENIPARQLFFNYAAVLSLIPAICGLVGLTIVGLRMPSGNLVRAPFLYALVGGVIGYVLNLAGLWVGAWAIKTLAPVFNSKASLESALILIIYAMTPFWVVGVLQLLPFMGFLSLLGFYGIYLLVLGLPVIMGTPQEKILWYTLAILGAGLVISFILSMISVGAIYGPMYMRMMAS
jgi:hypothetical protein